MREQAITVGQSSRSMSRRAPRARQLTNAGVLSQQGYRTAVFTLVMSLNGRAAGFNRFGALSRGFER